MLLGLSVATTRVVKLEKCLADSDEDVQTLSASLTRSKWEHVTALAKANMEHDLAL